MAFQLSSHSTNVWSSQSNLLNKVEMESHGAIIIDGKDTQQD